MDAKAEANPVKRAIVALGGTTQAIVKTGISEATWHRWRREGSISDARICFLLEELTGVPARELAGLQVIQGGAPTPPEGRKLKRGVSRAPASRCFPALAHRSTPAQVLATAARLVGDVAL